MITMCRSFNPVGQGAFYTESFRCEGGEKDKHVIYDCGSLQNSSLIQSAIRGQYAKGEIISAVFISHFDDDHINGLEYLLKYCSVKTLFLPLMQEENKALLLIKLLADGVSQHSFMYSFIVNPESVVGENTRIIHIEEYDGEDHPYESQGLFPPIDKSDDERFATSTYMRQTIASGTPCRLASLDWIYVPYNYKETKRRQRMIEILTNYNIELPKTPADVPALYLKYESILKECYLSLPGGINTNSMVVYSGPANPSTTDSHFHDNIGLCCDCNWKCRPRYHHRKVGCLYTGDYDASGADKWSELELCFSQYWDIVGTLQIPHHGSKHSYNPHLSKVGINIAVVSVGSSNKYRHPHGYVVRDMLLHGVKLRIVTEASESQANFVIRLRS